MKKWSLDAGADTALPTLHGLVTHRDVRDAASAGRAIAQRAAVRALTPMPRHRVGIISNVRSHRNRNGLTGWGVAQGASSDILYRAPRTLPDLARALIDLAEAEVELLVVDGGDGTLRDVLTCASGIFPGALPPIALVPSGKTNALAIDLGLPASWSVHDALQAARSGTRTRRAPIEILRPGSTLPDLRGFLFGTGAFVQATGLAQRTHKAGAFKGVAVGLSLGWALVQTFFGGRDNSWRAGETIRIRTPEGLDTQRDFYLLLGSTLNRLPLGLKPFGPVRDGLKVLAIDAPPQQMTRAVPAVLAGSQAAWLDAAGYHRGDPTQFDLMLDGGFILDGELYAGGELTVRRGEALEFVTP